MYHIYLDESYNLSPSATHPLFVLGGFGTPNPKTVAREYKRIRKRFLKRKQIGFEIKSFDKIALTKLIPHVFSALTSIDVVIYILRQDKKHIPFEYFTKNALNYEKLHVQLLTRLLKDVWNLDQYDAISVTIDKFQTKTSKKKIIESACGECQSKYPHKKMNIQFTDSASDLNLQIADFIVGSYFKKFSGSPHTPTLINNKRVHIIQNVL